MSLDRSSLPSAAEAGEEMHALATELFPFCRSLTGDGVRQTLDVIERKVPLERTAVPSGTQVYDWMLPREWNVRGARLTGPDGRVVADFADSNLHVLNYSVPVSGTFSLDELRSHLFTDPARPGVIPYRTSYHSENWGFCLPHSVYEQLPAGDYQVEIDSMLEDGELVYAERFLPGETDDEVLLSTYVCHPSLANDNLSGIVLAATLARHLDGQHLRRSHRFVFSPATIGPLTWLSRNEQRLPRIAAGMVVSCVGDPGPFTYKRSRRGDSEIDRAAAAVLGDEGRTEDFTPLGTDERQFCSPGFDLPIGVLSRTPTDRFPEYHSSADDLDFVRPQALGESFERYLDVLDVLERNRSFRNLSPKGEPQLGKRGLYRAVGGSFTEGLLLWVLNLSDGEHDLLAIAERSGLTFAEVADAADALVEAGLLAGIDGNGAAA